MVHRVIPTSQALALKQNPNNQIPTMAASPFLNSESRSARENEALRNFGRHIRPRLESPRLH